MGRVVCFLFGGSGCLGFEDPLMAPLAGASYQIVIAPAETGSREGLRAIEALIDRQADGVIAVSPWIEQSALESIARDTPVLVFGRHERPERYDSVAGDDVAGTGMNWLARRGAA